MQVRGVPRSKQFLFSSKEADEIGKHLAELILKRSVCTVQVGAAIIDSLGIVSVGWNSAGPIGLGEHAEEAAFRRANKRRLEGSILYVASHRYKSSNPIVSKPCPQCEKLIKHWGIRTVIWRDRDRRWVEEEL